MLRYIIFSTALLFAYSCNQKPVDTEAETAAIQRMFDDCNNDIREHGLLSEFKYLDSSADFFWAPPGYTLAMGYDTITKIMRANAELIKRVENYWDSLTIHVLNTETAVYTGIVHTTIMSTGGSIFKSVLLESGTLIKRKSGWKYLCGQTAILRKE